MVGAAARQQKDAIQTQGIPMNGPTYLPLRVLHALTPFSTVAPELAGRIAAHLAFRTTRRPVQANGRSLLERGRRFEIRDGRRRIAAWTWGTGPVVHLVHGWNDHAAQLGAFVAPLVASGHQVVAHDSPGHGESSGRSSSVVEMADALAAVAAATGHIHAVIGYELGGAAAALAIARGLPASRATFIATPADAGRCEAALFQTGSFERAAAHTARVLAERRLGARLDDLFVSSFGRALTLPVLVVHDRGDDRVPFEDALLAVRSIRDAGLIATDGLGHVGPTRDASTVQEVVQFTALAALQRQPERYASGASLPSRSLAGAVAMTMHQTIHACCLGRQSRQLMV
jgi:pimeloyl-ACP methyl ester carboxylesterase